LPQEKKGRILDLFVGATGDDRVYAVMKPGRKRGREHDAEVVTATRRTQKTHG
jgi:hypothetical protein